MLTLFVFPALYIEAMRKEHPDLSVREIKMMAYTFAMMIDMIPFTVGFYLGFYA